MPMECNIIFTPFGVSVIFFASLCLSMKTSGGNFLNDKSLVNTEAVMKVFWLCSTFSLSNFYMDIFLVCLMKLRRSLIFRFKYLNFVSKLYSLSKHFYLCIPCSKSSFSHFAFLSYLKQKKIYNVKNDNVHYHFFDKNVIKNNYDLIYYRIIYSISKCNENVCNIKFFRFHNISNSIRIIGFKRQRNLTDITFLESWWNRLMNLSPW